MWVVRLSVASPFPIEAERLCAFGFGLLTEFCSGISELNAPKTVETFILLEDVAGIESRIEPFVVFKLYCPPL